jgi:hypothetical protein
VIRLSGSSRIASIRVLDCAGRLVRILDETGDGSWTWDGRDALAREVPGGIYLLEADGHTHATRGRALRLP